MSQTSVSNAMTSMLNTIHKVEGFDPSVLAVEYVDLTTQEKRKRLPVMAQLAWFRLKYPEGKIASDVVAEKDYFVASARVYVSYKDPVECYLAEATASRGKCEEKPSVSPREWAQTAAVGIALRNAGFGLQFAMAGEDFESLAPDELGLGTGMDVTPAASTGTGNATESEYEYTVEDTNPPKELTTEEKVAQAMQVVCPISKFGGKTLGEVLREDPKAIRWVAEKYPGSEETRAAAKLICEYAMQQATA